MIHALHSTPCSIDAIEQRFREFAVRYILPYPDLHQQSQFPERLWDKMREHRLFGIGIDREYNGQADSQTMPYRLLSIAGNAMAAHGGNLGVCLSWMIHELTARWLIQSFGTEDQKNTWLPEIAAGKITACLAISEPGVGAHPKRLATVAETISDGFKLNGEKTYLTNAPLADLFIVIAVTGTIDEKKRFTAFLVPKNTPGFTLSAPVNFPFLRPSPHGGIVLKDCLVTPGQILGPFGQAYEGLVLPFRTVEDTLMMGPIAGGLAGLFQYLVQRLNHQQIILDESVMTLAARLHCTVESLNSIAAIAADILDTASQNEKLTTLGLFFRNQAGECMHHIGQIIEKTGILPNQTLGLMINDLSAILRIAENVSRIKLQKLGKRLFTQPSLYTAPTPS